VRDWVKTHTRQVKEHGGVRIVACPLPSKAPWLNPIEPKWMHGKKAIVEAEQVLTAHEVEMRVCPYYGCDQDQHLQQPTPAKKKTVKKQQVA
jgi:hypothetical protein